MELSESGIVSREIEVVKPSEVIDFSVSLFSAFYRGLGAIYSVRSPNSAAASSLKPSLSVYVRFFDREINNFTKPFIIYQTNANDVILAGADCGPDFIKIEFRCLLYLNRTTSLTTTTYNFLLISFLSSGSVTNIKEIPNDLNAGKLPKQQVKIKNKK